MRVGNAQIKLHVISEYVCTEAFRGIINLEESKSNLPKFAAIAWDISDRNVLAMLTTRPHVDVGDNSKQPAR